MGRIQASELRTNGRCKTLKEDAPLQALNQHGADSGRQGYKKSKV